MSLSRDELKPCAGCGVPCDGDTCNPACSQRADELRERHEAKVRDAKLREVANTHKAFKAARKAQLANILGPKA